MNPFLIRKIIYPAYRAIKRDNVLTYLDEMRTVQVMEPEAVRKILYLAIERISKRWKRPIKDWVAALNHFSVVFEGRIPV
jgi:putative transposase